MTCRQILHELIPYLHMADVVAVELALIVHVLEQEEPRGKYTAMICVTYLMSKHNSLKIKIYILVEKNDFFLARSKNGIC